MMAMVRHDPVRPPRRVPAGRVVVGLDVGKFSFQITCIPKQHITVGRAEDGLQAVIIVTHSSEYFRRASGCEEAAHRKRCENADRAQCSP